MMDFYSLPIYKHKKEILDALEKNQVIIIESPTGSGKTTQLPLILHEACYDNNLMIGITEPRRIAASNVTSFIKQQLNLEENDSRVALKMRFQDDTTPSTKIKVMTDGILLEEIKKDPYLSAYSVLMIDEAHERSLNIDFTLGLLKGILPTRKDLKVIISSATINPKEFSVFFDNAPILSISGRSYDVEVKYVPLIPKSKDRRVILDYKVDTIVDIVTKEVKKRSGDILIFLSGESAIKSVYSALKYSSVSKKLDIYPLYSRLSKEEQNSVFAPTKKGLTKVVVATNIAETSITIDGITVVIDSGEAKSNYYNQYNFTSTLQEEKISRSNAEQRKGRAGRTREGICYRLYSQSDFLERKEYPSPEILRSDLSDVVLRSSDLGITDAENFPFISKVSKESIHSAYDTLYMLGALDKNHAITEMGKFMMSFPLSCRHSRILSEAVYAHPGAIKKVLIAVSFISSKSPFASVDEIYEDEAKKRWKKYRTPLGDFVAFLHLFEDYITLSTAEEKKHFCEVNFIDYECMKEICSVEVQLEDIMSEKGIPITDDCTVLDYMLCIAEGLKQFIIRRVKAKEYISLHGDKVVLSPSTFLSSYDDEYLIASELAGSGRLFARNVSPLKAEWISLVSGDVYKNFYFTLVKKQKQDKKNKAKGNPKGKAKTEKSTKKSRRKKKK